MPNLLLQGEPPKVFSSNKRECYSELSVKKIVVYVLKYVKKHPEALDLMINDSESEIEGEAQSIITRSDQIYKELRSLQKPVFEYSLFDTNNGCPVAIVRFLKQIPEFPLQLRKYPDCLLAIFGCNQEFEIKSTSSRFCEILLNIRNLHKIPRPDSTHEFVLPSSEISFESVEPNSQIPFHVQESNESQSESEIKQLLPKYFLQEKKPTEVIEPEHKPSQVPVNIQPINDTYMEPIYIGDTESSYESKAINFKDHKLVPLSLLNKPTPITIQEPEASYNSKEVVEDTYIDDVKEKLKSIYVEHPELIHAQEFKPGHKPVYIEKLNQISVDDHKLSPIHVKKPKPIAVQELQHIYGDKIAPDNNLIHRKFPVYVDESTPTHGAEYNPTYVDDIYPDKDKEKPKPIYVEHPELIYVQESKPSHKLSVVHQPTPIYVEKLNHISFDELNHQKTLPINEKEPKPIYYQRPIYLDESTPIYGPEYSPTYVEDSYQDVAKEKPKPIHSQKSEFIYDEQLKPGNKPIVIDAPASAYVDKLNPIFVDEAKYHEPPPIHIMEPKPVNHQHPVYFDETKYSAINEEEIYRDDVKEKYKPIYIERPKLIYAVELKPDNKPTVIHEPAPVYVEKHNPNSADEPKHQNLPLIHVKDPKLIAIQEPAPIYIENEGPINKPIHIEEPKSVDHQYPVYFDEPKPIHGTNMNDMNEVKEKPKPIYAESSELPYTEQIKPSNKPTSIEEPALMYVEKLNPIFVDESNQKLLPIHINDPKSIAIHEPEAIHGEKKRPGNKPIYIGEPEPIYHQHPVYFDEAIPFFGTKYSPTYVKDIYSKEVKEKKPIYVDHQELIDTEELKPDNKPIIIDEAVYVEKGPLNYKEELNPGATKSTYLNEPKPIYVKDEKTDNIKKVVSFEKLDLVESSESTYVKNMKNPIFEIQPGYIDYYIPTHEKKNIKGGLMPTGVEGLESVYIDKLKPIFIEKPERVPINHNLDSFYIEKPDYTHTDEIKPEPTYVENENDYIENSEADTYNAPFAPELISKPEPIYVEESSPVFKLKHKTVVEQPESMPDYIDQLNTYFEKPEHIDYPDQQIIYPEAPELLHHDQLTHVEDYTPLQAPEITLIKEPNNEDPIQPTHMPQIPKEQPMQQAYTQILSSNIVEQITQLINNNPEKHLKNIKEVLQENQHVIKPRLYKILFSVLNALIKGIVNSERFSEIVNYLIQPRINSEWNNKKTQILYYLLSPGKTGQVEPSTLDVIYGLIHQPENTSTNPQMLDLMFPLLIKIKTENVDHRITNIILALLDRNKNNIFSDKEVETLLTFIKPNKMGYIPKQRVDIATMLVNFDKIPYFSQGNIKTIFLLMSPNKTGRIDPRAIQILTEILLPKKLSFLSEQNIIDLLRFLRTDNGKFIHPKRLDIALFLIKSKPQAPILIDCFINSLKEHDIFHSKFIDIILYLNRNKMLPYNVLETLVSLLSQEKSGHIDSKTYNSFLLLLEPYKSSRPKVVLHVYYILNREKFLTPNLDMSTLPHNIQVLIYYLMNSGTKQFDQTLNKGYNQSELKKLLSNVLKSEPVQDNELVPQLLQQNNGYVELTYLLNGEEPILYNPIYYVKYNIPAKIFLRKIQDIITSNPELNNDPPKLLRELTRAGSVSGVSPNLNGVQNEEILKLTFADGKLVQTKVLDEKKLNLNDQIKLIQDFNSNTSPQEIMRQSEINAAKYYAIDREIPSNLAGTGSLFHGGNIGSLNGPGPIVMSLKKNDLREFKTTGESKRTYNSTQTALIGVEDVSAKNGTELQQNNEN